MSHNPFGVSMSTAFQLSKSLARNAPREFWFLPSLFSPGIRLQAHDRKMKGSACILRTCPGIITLTWSCRRLNIVAGGSSCLLRAVFSNCETEHTQELRGSGKVRLVVSCFFATLLITERIELSRPCVV